MAAPRSEAATSRAKAPSMKVKKGDTVLVLVRQGQGRQGPGHRRLPAGSRRCSSRASAGSRSTPGSAPRQRGAQQGGIVTQEAPIHVSNVMVVGPDDKPTRVGYRKDEDGRSIRVSRRTGKDL